MQAFGWRKVRGGQLVSTDYLRALDPGETTVGPT